jgi:hypothetical protein
MASLPAPLFVSTALELAAARNGESGKTVEKRKRAKVADRPQPVWCGACTGRAQ